MATASYIEQLMAKDPEIDLVVRRIAKQMRMEVYRLCDTLDISYPSLHNGGMGGLAGFITSIPDIGGEDDFQ
jgi:hypothetical protein